VIIPMGISDSDLESKKEFTITPAIPKDEVNDFLALSTGKNHDAELYAKRSYKNVKIYKPGERLLLSLAKKYNPEEVAELDRKEKIEKKLRAARKKKIESAPEEVIHEPDNIVYDPKGFYF
jgi:hypothetical protein